MPKLWFCLLAIVFAARAGVITSTTVSCDGVPASVSCIMIDSTAAASISPGFTSVAATASAQSGFANAAAQYQGDLDFTVTAGPAMGYFEPCLELDYNNNEGDSTVSGSFGNLWLSGFGKGSQHTCGAPLSFNLGVPQDFQAELFAEADASNPGGFGNAYASTSATLSFQFFDSSMNSVQASSSLTPGPQPDLAPEPSTVFPLLGGLAFLALSLARGKRLNAI